MEIKKVFSLAKIAIFLIKAYKSFVSPLLPPSCRFFPTCSEYSCEAIQRHGFCIGICLSVWRVLRCNPFCRSGYDPVPDSVSFANLFRSNRKGIQKR